MAIQNSIHGLRHRGTFNVDIKLDGDWVKYNRLISDVDIMMVMAARQGQRAFAEEYRDKVKKNIRTGGKRFGYPQNAPNYLRRKMQLGGSSGTLTWSETFLNSVEVVKNTSGTHWGVGIEKGKKRPDYASWDKNRLQVHEIANIMENGLPPRVPKRPVFKDTFKKDMGGKKGLSKTLEISIIKNFGARGFRVNKM